jgi:argininosuccinate synthase
MANLADLQTRIDAAVAAMDAADWDGCIRLADGAMLIMAAIPDSTFDGNDQIRFDRQGAAQILGSIKKRANSALANASGVGYQTNDIEYTRR